MLNRVFLIPTVDGTPRLGRRPYALEQHIERMSDLRLLQVTDAIGDDVQESPGGLGDSQAYHKNNQLQLRSNGTLTLILRSSWRRLRQRCGGAEH